jgi:protease-4
MKQFFKMMFASALGVCVAVGILIFIAITALISTAATMGKTTYTPKENTVYKISLNGLLSDQVIENPLDELMGEKSNLISLQSLLYSIEQAKLNNNVKGIYLDANMFSAGSASLEALRRSLIDFKTSGKFVIAYADNFTQGCYYLCSVADKVYLNPQGILDIHGLASQTMFYTGLLEKLGVKMQIFKVGTYKGAVEPFILDKLSDANRAQIDSYIGSVWGNIVNGISTSRNLSSEVINQYANKGSMFAEPTKAVELGLIDALKYRTDVEEEIKSMAGQSGTVLKTAPYDKMITVAAQEQPQDGKIAVLYAEGTIQQNEPASSPLSTSKAITEKVANELIKLKNDASIKAVVLRVNSPGGSAYTSEQIWKQVVELRKVKPIVISMGDVAASGGYYIACAANKIIAEPNTLTGSIGIFGMFPNVAGTLNKIDLTTDVVKTNTYADFGDFSRPMSDGERALLQAFIERGYETFITRCADGRGKTKEEINEVGQGRVWTGSQALEIGLVDELGGIELAVSSAAELAELDAYSVTHVSTQKDFLTTLLEKELENIKLHFVKSFLGSSYEDFAMLNQIKQSTGIQARIPFDLKPL